MAKKAVVKKESENVELVPVSERNVFEQYGSQMSQSNITGQLLKFSKGDWLFGQDDEEMKAGTKLVANIPELMVGWIKWVDNKPVEQLMGRLADGFQPKRRSELGDNDDTTWEVDAQGKPRDPWQFTNYLLMKRPGKKAVDDELFTFTTSSRGGLGALGALCKTYGQEMRTKPDELPIVELDVNSYNHPNKDFGRIKVPVFNVVGWESKSLSNRA